MSSTFAYEVQNSFAKYKKKNQGLRDLTLTVT